MTETSEKVGETRAVQINVGHARRLTVTILVDGRVSIHDSPGCLFQLVLLPQEASDLATALSRAVGPQ